MSMPDNGAEVAKEILRQGEVRLAAQAALATAADQRATTLCGMFGAAAIALLVAVLAVLSGEKPKMVLVWPGVVSTATLYLAAILAGWAATPTNFHAPGARASLLRDFQQRPLSELLLGQAARYEERIDFNAGVLALNATRAQAAVLTGLASPILGVVTYLAAIYMPFLNGTS